jgi:hypothetical protein
MSVSEIWTLILGIVAVLSLVGWATLYSRARSLIKNALELKKDYEDAVADGNITDAEKDKMVEHLIYMIQDVTAIYQSLYGVIIKLVALFRRR